MYHRERKSLWTKSILAVSSLVLSIYVHYVHWYSHQCSPIGADSSRYLVNPLSQLLTCSVESFSVLASLLPFTLYVRMFMIC